jgi:hypothetical protein
MKKKNVSKKTAKLDLDAALEEVAKKLRPSADCEPGQAQPTKCNPDCDVNPPLGIYG